MFNKVNMMAVAIFVMAIFASACSDTETSQPERKTEVNKTSVTPKKQSGVLYVPSELALLMRKMYDNMEFAGKQINSGIEISDSLVTGYETILTAEATNPDEIDSKFYGFANGWLGEIEVLRNEKSLENYNAIMNACVNCHQSYCPGPIPKIKRLKIMP